MTEPDPDIAAARKLFARDCVFVAGAPDAVALPASKLPEIAFAGRSNVGKSSLINALVRRKRLARVSNTPGRTRAINLFELGGALMLADLPGYGYAKVSRSMAEDWQREILAYLHTRPNLRRAIVLIDARRGLMDSDRQAMTLLDKAAVSFAVALTKSDKLKPAMRDTAAAEIAAELRGHPAAFANIYVTSAETGFGLDALKAGLAALAAA
jgi:GTP-binding protein